MERVVLAHRLSATLAGQKACDNAMMTPED